MTVVKLYMRLIRCRPHQMDLFVLIFMFAVPIFGFPVGVIVLRYPTQFVEYHSKLETGDETVAKLVAVLLVILSLFLSTFSVLLVL